MFYDGYNFVRKLTTGKIVNYLKLRLSYFFSMVFRKPLVWGNPAVATIEPTNICNLHCIECPTGNNSLTRNKGYIDTLLYKRIIDELSPNLTWLMLYFQGEPLLHRQLPELIGYASARKIYTVISTNGHQISSENAKKLVESGLDRVIISLDGVNQESYSKYRKGGDFNLVLSGIKNLVHIKKELKSRKPFIILQFLVMSHNENQMNEIKHLGNCLGVDKTVYKTMQVTDFENNIDFLPKIKKYSRYAISGNEEITIKKKQANRCSRLWSTMVFLQDGVIVPCCFDKDATFKMGKSSDNSILEIWRGKHFNRFRKQILNSRDVIQMCGNCTEGGRILTNL